MDGLFDGDNVGCFEGLPVGSTCSRVGLEVGLAEGGRVGCFEGLPASPPCPSSLVLVGLEVGLLVVG